MLSEKLLLYIKEYIKVDGNEEDNLISSFILSSEIYLKNAGVKFDEENELHKLTLAMLTSQRYEDRLGKSKANNTFILNSLIAQIKD